MRGVEAKTAQSGEVWLVKVGFERAGFQRSGLERAADSDDSQRREAGWECFGFGWLRFPRSFVPGKLGLG